MNSFILFFNWEIILEYFFSSIEPKFNSKFNNCNFSNILWNGNILVILLLFKDNIIKLLKLTNSNTSIFDIML